MAFLEFAVSCLCVGAALDGGSPVRVPPTAAHLPVIAEARGGPGRGARRAQSQETEVRRVVSRYLHGLKYNDTTAFVDAFWPESRLMFVRRDGTLGQLSQSEWYRGFRANAGKEEAGTLAIENVDVAGDAANVKVRETYATSVYVDYLNLLRIGDEWRIVNKIYSVKRTAPPSAS